MAVTSRKPQTTEQKQKSQKKKKQHIQEKTKHTKRKTGIVNMDSSVGEKRCLMHHYRVISKGARTLRQCFGLVCLVVAFVCFCFWLGLLIWFGIEATPKDCVSGPTLTRLFRPILHQDGWHNLPFALINKVHQQHVDRPGELNDLARAIRRWTEKKVLINLAKAKRRWTEKKRTLLQCIH